MSAGASSWVSTLVFVPLVAFALYRRYKGSFGRQPLRAKRMMFRMILLSILCVVFLIGIPTTTGIAAAAGGAVIGISLGILGLRHTQFEASAEGKFYTPNKWIGLVVTALFLGRFVARLLTVSETVVAATPGQSPLAGLQRSPLTLGIFFLMATYYVCYYGGILRKSRDLTP